MRPQPRLRRKGEGPRTTRRRAGRHALAGLCVLPALIAATASIAGGGGQAVVIPIHGEINDIVRDSVKRRLGLAREQGATTIIFEMNTPGGMVTSSIDICQMIKDLPAETRTVAWVRNQALSAGAMISVACGQIVMTRASSIGDCAPIMVGPTGGLEEIGARELAKIESPIRQEFRDSATRNGYDQLLCLAMVTVDTEVWWVERIADGTREFVTGDEKKRRVDDPAEDAREWRLVTVMRDPSDREFPVDQPIDRSDTLLTMSQTEAYAYGFARGIASDLPELMELLELTAEPQRLDMTGWEAFARWLNSPLVRGILFVLFMVGGYIEFQHPGLILPGAVALLALAIFLAAPYAAGLADVWTIVLLVIGLILLAVEVFILPGFGLAGVLGVVLILAAFLGTFVPPEPIGPEGPSWSLPALQGTWDALKTGVLVLSGAIIVSVIGLLFLIRYLPHMPGVRTLISDNPRAAAMSVADPFAATALVGDVGVVTGALRPGGQARFGGEIVEVQSQGEYVEAGRRVQVVRREGMTITVRPLPDESA